MPDTPFAGAQKENSSLLVPLERRIDPTLVRLVPSWLETYHLTLMTIVWSGGVVASCLLARGDIRWLWGASVMIALQWLTDHIDGKVGKARGTGLLRWGYYMDHLLDYVFLCALIVGYACLIPESARLSMLVLLAVSGGFMVHMFLEFSATDRFRISAMKLGPTEARLALIVINAVVIRTGAAAIAGPIPYIAGGGCVALCVLVFNAHRRIWRIDMDAKNGPRRATPPAAS